MLSRCHNQPLCSIVLFQYGLAVRGNERGLTWYQHRGSVQCKLYLILGAFVVTFGMSDVPVYRYEIDKLTASQRLDLNLEKGRMRDELQALRDKANELEIKMDKETNSLKAAVEQTKNETIKYCLGMMLAFTTAGLGAARLVSH